MMRLLLAAALASAHCLTVPDPDALAEYEAYAASAGPAGNARFEAGEPAWGVSKDAAARFAAGKLVRVNVSDPALNRRLGPRNGTVIHWVGAVRIRGAALADLRAVLEDYPGYGRIYRPMISGFEARPESGGSLYQAAFGLRNTFRLAGVLPQHYAFRVRARIEYTGLPGALRVHLRSAEIRESDSGVPGRNDLLPRYRDHGILWALNAWWRARPMGPDVYLEFETVTLARSVEAFACKVGFVPVAKSVVSSAMHALPAEALETILEGTRAECERRANRAE